MKTKIRIYIITFNLLFIIGCTTSYYLKPVINDDDMEMMYFDGKEVAISKDYETGVAIYGMKTTQNELILHILYRNNTTEKKINVLPEQIRVAGYNTEGKVNYFKVYPAEEYLKKMRSAQAWAVVLQGAAGALEASQAGKSTSTTTGSSSANIYGSDGTSYTGYGSTSSSTTTYDYGAQAEANARNNAQLEKTAEQYAQISAATEQGLIKANTLFPEQYVEGNVMVKMNTIGLP
ncbi:MAG: hypothetical protein HN921_05485 [Bacteroidetes bacterium]|jgi:hypothetical protein|nr:hypothetical protein [Bacteroidota bacterium]MBT7039273.1 hypothetical protein [Bacteroidota bacterium]